MRTAGPQKPDRMPDGMPEDMPDRMPEDMSARMPEDLPVTRRVNVMVGMTRSKLLFVCIIILHFNQQLGSISDTPMALSP